MNSGSFTTNQEGEMDERVRQLFKADGKNAIHDGIEHEPGGGKALLDPADTVLLLLDHQSGLFQNVKDITMAELRANVTALAKLAAMQQIPVITTASVPEGPNGPLIPEIHTGRSPCGIRAAEGRGQRLGQCTLCQDGARNRQADVDHGRGVDQCLRHVPGARRQGGRFQGLCCQPSVPCRSRSTSKAR
jgi:hypothetical protein